MKFKEAYSLLMSGKRMAKPTLSMQNPTKTVKYLTSGKAVNYIEDKITSAKIYVVAIDCDDMPHQIDDRSVLDFVLSEDDDWSEYVEPAPIEHVSLTLPCEPCGECQC